MRIEQILTEQELEEINWKKIGKGVAAAGLAGAMAMGSAGAKADAGTDQMGMSWNDMGDKIEIVQAKTETYKNLLTMQAQKQGKTLTPTLQRIIDTKAKEKALADYNSQYSGQQSSTQVGNNSGSYSRNISNDW